jgi:hypothetical protein
MAIAHSPLVDAPAFTPLPYGLWDTAQHPAAPAHWQQGVTWIDRCPTGDTTYDECLTVTGTGEAPPAPPAKTDNVVQTLRGATAFTVFAEFDCSPVGLTDAATVAADSLARVEHSQVEAAFWTGTAGGRTVVFPHLAANAEVVDSSGIVLQQTATVAVTGDDVAVSLGQLEHQLDQCLSAEGVIHIPRFALPTFTANFLVTEVNGQLRTQSGNLVVVSGDYTGSSPAGAAPAAGTAWVYATGPLFAYRSEVFATQVPESFDRAENTVKMIAERTYVVGYSCCLLATLINLGVPTS